MIPEEHGQIEIMNIVGILNEASSAVETTAAGLALIPDIFIGIIAGAMGGATSDSKITGGEKLVAQLNAAEGRF